MPNDKLDKLRELYKLMANDTVRPEEIEGFLKMVIEALNREKNNFQALSAENLQEIKNALSYIYTEHSQILKEIDAKKGQLEGTFKAKIEAVERLLAEVKAIEVKDGKDGVDGKNGLDGKDGKPGKDGSPDTPEQIKEKLQTLKKAWLEVKAIKGLDTLLNEAGNNWLNQAKGFVPRSLDSLYDTDIINPIDGQAVVWNAAKRKFINGAVVSSSVGTGFTKLTATGTVNGTNADFTFTEKPTYIVSDGAWYVENSGWTWSGLTATLSVPPQTGIWGFV